MLAVPRICTSGNVRYQHRTASQGAVANAVYRTAPVPYITVLYCSCVGRCPVVPILCTCIYFKHILEDYVILYSPQSSMGWIGWN